MTPGALLLKVFPRGTKHALIGKHFFACPRPSSVPGFHKYLVNIFRMNLYIQTGPACMVSMENQNWANKGNQWGLKI